MKRTLAIRGLSPAVNSFLLHIGIVFLATFGTALTTGATTAISVPTLLALLYSSAAAGLAAAIHFALGFIPTPVTISTGTGTYLSGYAAVAPKVETRLYQILLSVLVTFASIFGAALAAGGLGVTSLPTLTDAITAAIAAAVSAVVSYLAGLVPAPKPAA